MKYCKHCQIEKPLSEFRQKGKYYETNCKPCESAIRKQWAKDNRERATETAREYRQTHAEQHKESVARYNKAHPDRRRKTHREYIAGRKLKDINFKLACALRSRLGTALKDNAKSGSAVKDLGCTIPFLREYLQNKFLPGMTWGNWTTDGWHIDHIKPLASFDLTDPDQFKAACHYTNLQPLWAEANIIKSCKVA